MSAEQRDQQEPSMEEILSSIRRIIADEEADEGTKSDLQAADDHDDEEGEDEEDVLELTKVVRDDGGEVVDLQGAPADEPPAAPATAAGEDAEEEPSEDAGDDIEMTSLEREPAAEPVAQEAPAMPSSSAATRDLISDSAATAATGAFAKLSKAYQRTPEDVAIADASGRSVEQFIEDMIRPMLKEWLDENMPPLVERLVEKEIQKLARRSELI